MNKHDTVDVYSVYQLIIVMAINGTMQIASINWLSGATNWKWSFLELKIGRPQKHTRTKPHMDAGTLPKKLRCRYSIYK